MHHSRKTQNAARCRISPSRMETTSIEILIVEPHPAEAQGLQATLTGHGYGVAVAQTGREALDAVHAHAPTMLISTTLLPDMSGYDLCQRIKADDALKEIPVILLTPLSDPQDIIRGMESGANNFIVKPYEEKFLLSRIRYILANQELRKITKSEMGIEIFFSGKKYFFTPDRIQMIDLLLSTYETAVQKNLQLEETRVNYLTLLETSADAIVVVDRQQRVQFVNPAAARLFDRPANALLNQPFDVPIRAGETKEFTIARRDSSAAIAEMRVVETNWREEPAYLATLRDITQRKRDEEAIRHRNQELSLISRVSQMFSSSLELSTVLDTVLDEVKNLLNAFSVSLWLFDAATDELVCMHAKGPGGEQIMNMRLKSGQGLTGWAAKQNQSLLIADSWNDARHFKNIAQEAQDTSRSMLCIPLRSKGAVIGVLNLTNPNVGHFTPDDVTLLEPVAAAAANAIENARLYTDAQQANQSKSMYLASMSHELRTPLNAVLGFAQLLSRSQGIGSDERDDLAAIIRSGEHLLTLINQVLDLSKIEAGKMPVNLADVDILNLLDDLIDLFRQRAGEKGLEMRFDCAADVPRVVETDEMKLRQVLINLLANAVKFTRRGSVTLRVRRGVPAGAAADALPLELTVEDTGPGIAPRELQTLFERFMQTAAGRKEQEGTGLGLAISQKFVRLLGGEISVSSAVGQGTTFTCVIPMRASAAPPPPAAELRRVVGLQAGQPPRRIAIADSREDNRMLIRRMLQPLGVEIREARNGRELLDLWASWQPDIALLELVLPLLDGYEVMRRIRRDAQAPVCLVALSAIPFEEQRQAAFAAGCDDFLRKPFHEHELFDALQRHAGLRYLYEEQSPPPERRAKAVAPIPSDLLQQMEQATRLADMTMLTSVLDEVACYDTDAADLWRRMAKKFEYGAIADMVKMRKSQNNA